MRGEDSIRYCLVRKLLLLIAFIVTPEATIHYIKYNTHLKDSTNLLNVVEIEIDNSSEYSNNMLNVVMFKVGSNRHI